MNLTADQRKVLIERAQAAQRRAYAPYSNYAVGAALLTDSGKIYEGANVENAVYNLGVCAERNAVFTAVAQGEREIVAVAVVSDRGGTPCGACRQVISEFGGDPLVIIADRAGTIVSERPLSSLLPDAFGRRDLRLEP
jgi:cytidine deaminase